MNWIRGRAVLLVCAVAISLTACSQEAEKSDAERGKYLVTLAACSDCHTPGTFLGKPDMTRFLGGSDVGFEIPQLGAFYAPNLTSDKATGLGGWTDEQIATVLTTGVRPDGRVLVPVMPYGYYANLTPEDLKAIIAFLRTLPPVQNKVIGPFGPTETPTGFVQRVVPPGVPAVPTPATQP